MKFGSIGTTLLAIFLLAYGILNLEIISFSNDGTVLAVLALIAGIFALIGK